jgi:hypothetical protein
MNRHNCSVTNEIPAVTWRETEYRLYVRRTTDDAHNKLCEVVFENVLISPTHCMAEDTQCFVLLPFKACHFVCIPPTPIVVQGTFITVCKHLSSK